MTKNQLGAAVVLGACAILGAITFFGYSPFVKTVQQFVSGSASPSGTTGSTAKFISISNVSIATPGTVGATGANGTSTSILNTFSYDLYARGSSVVCNGVGTSKAAYTGSGLSALTVSIGTTSTAAPATLVSFAQIVNNITLSTSTTLSGFSTTTQVGYGPNNGSATSSLALLWPTGTYMTFAFNATNTASCTLGVDAIPA